MDYVFVGDVSGSMADDGKLALSRGSVRAFLAELGPEDRFELLSFNVAAQALFGSLSAVKPDALARATAFLDAQRARGGTSLRPAVEAAYRYRDADRQLNVVILSDGMTEEREHQQLLRLIADRPGGVRVFCIGVGNEVNRPLLKQVARDSGGLAAFLSRGDDFRRQAKAFRRKLLRPAIGDVSLRITGGGIHDVEPETLPNLYHGSPIRVYARYHQPGPIQVTLRGTVQGAKWERQFDLELPKLDAENPEIERMWAWHRVQRLFGDERRAGSPGKHRDEIVRLCEGFSIPSEYASFLVLENDQEYQRWKIARRNATRIERDRAARQRLRTRLDEMRDRSARRLGPVETGDVAQTPATKRAQSPTPTRRTSPPPTSPRRRSAPVWSRGGGGSGGGGPIDPLTGTVTVALLALLAAGRRRRDNASRQG
jgi:Ca-activated chloride channel family protein